MMLDGVGETPPICLVCAWRADCAKRFTLTGGINARCVEFTRDLTIRASEDESGDEVKPSKESEKWPKKE